MYCVNEVINRISCNPLECCGCGACIVSCPKKTIHFRKNKLGFELPYIDNSICVNCGVCKGVCPFTEENSTKLKNSIAHNGYAAQNNKKNQIKKSASGGVFSEIAYKFINNGGVVYGAAWNQDFTVSHIRINQIDKIELLQGSKYTQSKIIDCFDNIKNDLDKGVKVLFSGTPCQVASIKAFLKKEYDNLYLIDLICHGVGAPRMLQDELKYFENKYKAKLKSVSFRTKKKGWGTSGELVFEDGKYKTYDVTNSPYYYYYLDNSIFRDSCYNCKYACENRPGDLTIGDYWRIETAHPEIDFDEKDGISCILVNNSKGSNLLNDYFDDADLFQSSVDKIVMRNGQLTHSANDDSSDIKDIYIQLNDYKEFVKHYKKSNKKIILKHILKKIIPYRLKTVLKKLMK